MDENEEFEFRLRAEQEGAAAAPPPVAAAAPVAPPPPAPTNVEHLQSGLSTFARHPFTAGIGMAENALSGVTGGVGSLLEAISGRDPGSIDTAYRPRTEAGQEIAALGADEGHQIGKVYDQVAGEGPLAQTLKERLPQAAAAVGTAVPLLEGGAAAGGAVARSAQMGAEAAGPFGLRSGAGQSVAKSIAGSSGRDALMEHNAQIGSKVAANEAGVAENAPLNYQALEKGREAPDMVYEQVAQTLPEGLLDAQAIADVQRAGLPEGGRISKGSPQAQEQIEALRTQLTDQTPKTGRQMVNELRALRQEGFHNSVADDVSMQQLGKAQLDMARAVESHIGRNLPQGGAVSLEQFQAARKALAKSYTVQQALKGEHVDMHQLARAQRADPELMDGPMADLATFANANKDVVGVPNTYRVPGLSKDVAEVSLTKPSSWVKPIAAPAARRLLTGNTSRAVEGANKAVPPRNPETFQPSRLTPPPGRAGRLPPEQMSLGDLLQGDGPAPWSLEDGAQPPAAAPAARPGEIPLADVLSEGVEQAPSKGLSLGDMVAPQHEGIPFTRDAGQMAGDLSLADAVAPAPDLFDDLASVLAEGVPEGIMQRTPPKGGSPDMVEPPKGNFRKKPEKKTEKRRG